MSANVPTNAPDVVWLDDPVCASRPAVGGKAAHLSQLRRLADVAGAYRVPDGFCLTAAALERAVAGGGQGGGEGDDTSAGGVGDGAAAGLASPAPGSPLAPDLLRQLAAAYLALGEPGGGVGPPVAVRSSAVDEDGAHASFAGQYESYLNVTGVAAVAGAVARCRSAVHARRVRQYRRQHRLPADGGRLAVLVQRLVPADVSAVLFSANPVTGDQGEVVITAAWGLGESLVGGSVTPDTYVVRKAGLTLASRGIAEKRRMTVAVPEGTREVETPRFLRSRPALDDEQVLDLARLAIALESAMGWPVDVECAFHDGALYLLQCRPVTALGASRAPAGAIDSSKDGP
jgi:pyruvate,water dikinase